MKVLIVSDTHKRNDNYFKVLQKAGPFDMVVHCGDAQGNEDLLKEGTNCPLQIVLGNNDLFTDLPRELEFNIGKYEDIALKILKGETSKEKTILFCTQDNEKKELLYKTFS